MEATILSRREGTLLVTDSAVGSDFRVNTFQGRSRLSIRDLCSVSRLSPVELGLHGLNYSGKGELFITSTNQGLLGRISIQ